MREWTACLGKPTIELPYEDEPSVTWVQERVRGQFGLGDDVLVADHVVCRASVLQGYMGIVRTLIPAVILEFQVGIQGRAPETAAKVLYLGDESAMLAFGELVQQSAAGAVRAAGEV